MRLKTLLFLAILPACQSRDRSAELVLYNRSKRNVHFYVTCDSSYKDFRFQYDCQLKAQDSVRPYLLWGPEGKGKYKNSWVNAIHLADDTALHVFFAYIDFDGDPNLHDSLFYLIVERHDYTVDSLTKLHWKIEYR